MAGWFDDAWAYRMPITAYSSTAAVSSTVTIPQDIDLFWDNVLASGADIRVCEADGITLVTQYDLPAGFNTATRAGTIEIAPRNTASSVYRPLWVYWGNASATSAATVFAPAGTGSISWYREAPTPDRIISFVQESPDSTQPSQTQRKGSGETAIVYIDVTDALIRRSVPYQGSDGHEGIQTIAMTATTGGVSATATLTPASTTPRMIEHGGRQYVGVPLSGGSSGTDYTVIVTMTTVLNYAGGGVWDSRTLVCRFVLSVYDVSEV